MKLYRLMALFLSGIFLFGISYALTSPYDKEVQQGIDLYLESDNLEYTPPTWFKPTSLSTASEDASYWINEVLPFPEDRNEDIYLVIPQLGLITPIKPIPRGSGDFEKMVNGQEIGINKYLNGGIIEYVNSAQPGHRGKRIDFGHSNFFKNGEGRYKTIFANLMALDPNDQAWYFVRNSSGGYDLHKYVVQKSYNTYPSNTSPLIWDKEGADALIFGCTHGLDGRRMVEATYMGTPLGKPVPYVDPYASLNGSLKARVNSAVSKINWLRPNLKKYKIVQIVKLVQAIRDNMTLSDSEKLLLDYIEERIVSIYPS